MGEPVVVLVVDDAAELRSLCRMVLEEAGYGVLEAADGCQALAVIAARPPALVLLDLQMPCLSGQDVVLALRAQGSVLPIVFMSAGLNARAEAGAYRADGYLAKPFDLDALVDTVDCLLRVHGSG